MSRHAQVHKLRRASLFALAIAGCALLSGCGSTAPSTAAAPETSGVPTNPRPAPRPASDTSGPVAANDDDLIVSTDGESTEPIDEFSATAEPDLNPESEAMAPAQEDAAGIAPEGASAEPMSGTEGES